jgi:hypothetical protein
MDRLQIGSFVMYQTLLVEAVQDSGRHAVRFNIGSNAAILDVDDVDLLIERLGQIRSGLSPALPHEPSRTHNYVIEIDASYRAWLGRVRDSSVEPRAPARRYRQACAPVVRSEPDTELILRAASTFVVRVLSRPSVHTPPVMWRESAPC